MNTLKSPIEALRTPTLDGKKKRAFYYNKFTFHSLRALSFISAGIVGAIFSSFAVTLWKSNFSIPWTFLLATATSYLTLICFIITSCIMCCTPSHPILNLFFNIPLSTLWIASTGIIVYNIYGTLSRSCNIHNWGNSDGTSICSIYKLMFSACVFATLSQLSLVVLDIRARRNQNRSGKYAKMDSTVDLKMEPFDVHRSDTHRQTQSIHDSSYTHDGYVVEGEFRDEPIGLQPGQRTRPAPGQVAHDGDSAYSPSVYSQRTAQTRSAPSQLDTHDVSRFNSTASRNPYQEIFGHATPAGRYQNQHSLQPPHARGVDMGTVRMDHFAQQTPVQYQNYQAYPGDPSHYDNRDSYLDRRY